ncbi:MAG: HAD family hydrolase [Eubacteriaceae bacterium]|jgi:HAD superfamily hydrolase (TIGR01509 family)
MKYLEDYSAVIFDFDGTLVDSMALWHEIDCIYLGSRGLEVPPDLHEAIAGMSFEETACYFKNRFKLNDSISRIMKTWENLSHQQYLQNISFKPGADDYIRSLHRSGKLLGLATSNIPKTTEAYLHQHGLNECFGALSYTGNATAGKPDPAVFLNAAGKLGVKPENCLAFEDTWEGISAAKSAGMDAVAVRENWSPGVRARIEAKSDLVIDDYLTLPRELRISA